MTCFKLRSFWAVWSVLLPMFLVVAPAFCASTSGSAGVLLTGTLEDLSVQAVSAPATPTAFARDMSRVTLKTGWAVAPHATTFQFSATYIPRGARSIPGWDTTGEVGIQLQNSGSAGTASRLAPGAANVYATTVPANGPVSRTEQIRVEQMLNGQAGASAASGTVRIRVQAL